MVMKKDRRRRRLVLQLRLLRPRGGGPELEADGSLAPTLQQEIPVPGPDVRTRAYEEALSIVQDMNEWYMNEIKQEVAEEMERFTLTTSPSPEDIIKFLAEKKQHSLNIAPMIIPVVVHGDKVDVPVTTPTPAAFEERTYHLVVRKDPITGDEVHLLVEECSGYIKAIKVVLKNEVASKKHWNLLLPDGLPTRFKRTRHTKYTDRYESLDSVFIHCGTFREIFRFFLSFNTNPAQNTTEKGLVILATTFLSLGELPRFAIVEQLVCEGLTRPESNPLKLPLGLSDLLHDWSALSKAVYLLFLAHLEAHMVRLGMSPPGAQKTMADARKLWLERQDLHPMIKFCSEQEGVDSEETPLSLGLLCGAQLRLLCHDPNLCNQVTLRRSIRYKGHWLDDIQDAYEAGELRMD